MYVCVYIYIYVCVFVYTHTHIYIYTYMYIHRERERESRKSSRIDLAESLVRLPHLVTLKLADCCFQGRGLVGRL